MLEITNNLIAQLPSLLLIFHNHALKNSGLDLKLIVFFQKFDFIKYFE